MVFFPRHPVLSQNIFLEVFFGKHALKHQCVVISDMTLATGNRLTEFVLFQLKRG